MSARDREYDVTWRVTVRAENPLEAARQGMAKIALDEGILEVKDANRQAHVSNPLAGRGR